MLGPWSDPGGRQRTHFGKMVEGSQIAQLVFVLALLAATATLVRAHVRLGRADLRGATRLALYAASVELAGWLFEADHVLDGLAERHMALVAVGYAAFQALFLWMVYAAIEPFARRRWPERMVSWSRLLAGRLGDAMVGRDILLGVVLGAILFLIQELVSILPLWVDWPGGEPMYSYPSLLTGELRYALSQLLIVHGDALMLAVGWFGALAVLCRWLRREWAGLAVTYALMFAVHMGTMFRGTLAWNALLFSALCFALWIFVAMRIGLLATVASVTAYMQLMTLPPLAGGDEWWLASTLVVLAMPLALAGLACWRAQVQNEGTSSRSRATG
jgi:hypothetical protein